MTTGKNADAALTLSLAFWYSGIYVKQPRSPVFFLNPCQINQPEQKS
jgi:hypothetical protein